MTQEQHARQWFDTHASPARNHVIAMCDDLQPVYLLLAEYLASHAPSTQQRSHATFEWDKHMHNCFTCLQRGYDFQYRQRGQLLERWPKSSGVPLPPEITSEAAAQPICIGYEGKCEGNLPGESHAENCPLAEIEHNDH